VCFGFIPGAWAQETQANRLVDYVSPSLLTRSATPSVPAQADIVRARVTKVASGDDVLKPSVTSSGDRMVRFEQEYGVERESTSAIGRMVQAAKYGLDKICFTVQEASKKLEYTYDIGSEPPSALGSGTAQPQYSLPVFGRFGHAQLKSEVSVHDPQTGEAFIGLKLSIPFGPGGREQSEVSRRPLRRGERTG
jgi:hypothetical protein